MKRAIRIFEIIAVCLLFTAPTASALKYGEGLYGTCQFSSCNITLTSDATVTASITPSTSAVRCSIVNHAISVSTGSSTGYTLAVSSSSAATALTRTGGGSINAVSGTPAAPTTLAANTWGYRIDGVQSFGTGPTSVVTNVATPSLTFAGVPASSSPQTLKTTAVAASPADATSVYYGICLNATLPNGTYSNTINYSATIN